MINYVLLGCLVGSIVFLVAAENPELKYNTGLIVLGTRAVPNQFPYQVGLHTVKNDGSPYVCGGSLISNRWVLTAAHCFVSVIRLYVSIGSIYYEDYSAINIVPVDVINHEQYKYNTHLNDISVVDLGVILVFSASVNYVRLPRRSQTFESFVGYTTTLTGWGLAYTGGPPSPWLNYVEMAVITNNKCAAEINNYEITDNNICTEGILSLSQGVCGGDSGGPSVILESDGYYTQIGVVSFASVPCQSNGPSILTRITPYLDWIQLKTGITVRP